MIKYVIEAFPSPAFKTEYVEQAVLKKPETLTTSNNLPHSNQNIIQLHMPTTPSLAYLKASLTLHSIVDIFHYVNIVAGNLAVGQSYSSTRE